MSAASPAHAFDTVPQCLRDRAQWVPWMLVQRDNQPKPAKVPVAVHDSHDGRLTKGGFGSSTASETWGTFIEALAMHLEQPGRYPGIGFVFTADDPYAFIDLDDVKTADGWDPFVAEVLQRIPSWAEYSQSGNGIHILCIAEGTSKVCEGIEFYTGKRFVAMTGKRLPETPTTINACQTGCDWLRGEIVKRAGRDIRDGSDAPVDLEALAVDRNLVVLQKKPGKWEVECPYGHEHGNGDPGGAVYMLAGYNGRIVSNYDCRHATCQAANRANIGALRSWLANNDPEYRQQSIDALFKYQSSTPVPGLESPVTVAVREVMAGIVSVADIDPEAIPHRPWLYGNHLLRGYVSILHGPGGVGKSMFAVTHALAMAAGKNIMNAEVKKESLNVLYMCNEDDIDEIKRRVVAASIHHQIDLQALSGRFDIKSGYDEPETLYDASDTPQAAQQRMQKWLDLCHERGYDVVVMDPLISLYRGLVENANEEMELVMEIIRGMTKRAGIALLVLAHNRKGGGEEGSEDDLRGASAQKDAARITRSLTRMTKENATKLEIDWTAFGRHLVRMDSGKANFTPPDAAADWYQLHDVRLPSGDHVGVPAPARLDDLKPDTQPVLPKNWEVYLVSVLRTYGEEPNPMTTIIQPHVEYATAVNNVYGDMCSAGIIPAPSDATVRRVLTTLASLPEPVCWLSELETGYEYKLREVKPNSAPSAKKYIAIERREGLF